MARCELAVWDEIGEGAPAYTGGPFKIVHHTTEGGSYPGARAAYAADRSFPHFTVDATTIHQHVDTGRASRALSNDPGGVETNRDSAVQIEVVGFASQPKAVATLLQVARLCRWIEATHAVEQVWPSGFPRFSTDGRDPGSHNRSATNWDARGGHYGHSQVPENTHWDPGYTPAEIALVTPAAPAPAALRAAFCAASLEPAAAAVSVGARPLVSVLFGTRDDVAVRIRDVRGTAVCGELLLHSGDGLALCRELPEPLASERTLRRKLVIEARVNGAAAKVRRRGELLIVEPGPAGGRLSEACARITVASYPVARKRRGGCPTR